MAAVCIPTWDAGEKGLWWFPFVLVHHSVLASWVVSSWGVDASSHGSCVHGATVHVGAATASCRWIFTGVGP